MFFHSRLFRRFLISYVVILAIPNIAGLMSYRTSASVMTNASIEHGVAQLEKSKELLERRLAEVEGFTRQLAINQDLGVLLNERVAEEDQVNVYGIWKMSRDVTTFGQTNDFLRHFFIYLSNYDVVLTPGSAYFRPEHYYANYHYEDLTFAEWKQLLGMTHRSEVMPLRSFVTGSGLGKTSVITYMQSLPLDSFHDESPAVVFVLIDEARIAELLSGITDRYGGWVHIGDGQGGTISLQGADPADVEALSSDEKFDETKTSQFYKDDLVITIRSEQNDWVYRAGIPRHALMENANLIRRITWTVTGAALLLGLGVGLVLAYRNTAPLDNLVGIFGQDAKAGRNEYDFLHGNIAEMISNNRKLESELRRQQPMIRDAFYKRLVAGEFQTREEIVASAVQANAGLSGNAGYVGLIQIRGYSGLDTVDVLNELHAARLIAKGAVSEQAGPVPMTYMGSDKIVVLFVSDEDGGGNEYSRERIDALFAHVSDTLYREFRISIVSAAGDRFASVTDIAQAFEQAKQALDFAAQTDRKTVAWFSETRVESSTYYYPLDVELRLIGKIKAGEVGEAKRALASIVERNTRDRELSFEMRSQLVLELKGTLLKLLDQKPFAEGEAFERVKERIVAIQGTESVERVQDEVGDIMEVLCGMVASRKNELHVQLVERVKAFVGERYSDADLTLYRIAEQVERPEKSISQLFKDVTGVNLSEYVERIRMEQASTLLAEPSLTIDEIASRVGYNSSHSFRRAFKRVTGVSPSDYRQSVDAG
jgi:AraC-like DNA-binding protein/transposase-like protein